MAWPGPEHAYNEITTSCILQQLLASHHSSSPPNDKTFLFFLLSFLLIAPGTFAICFFFFFFFFAAAPCSFSFPVSGWVCPSAGHGQQHASKRCASRVSSERQPTKPEPEPALAQVPHWQVAGGRCHRCANRRPRLPPWPWHPVPASLRATASSNVKPLPSASLLRLAAGSMMSLRPLAPSATASCT